MLEWTVIVAEIKGYGWWYSAEHWCN